MFQNTFLFCNIGLYAAIIILINDYMRKSAMFWNPASGQKMNLHPGQQKYRCFPLRNKKVRQNNSLLCWSSLSPYPDLPERCRAGRWWCR